MSSHDVAPSQHHEQSSGGREYVSVHHGDFPIIIAVPHGGRHTPEGFVEREHGVMCDDDFTAELSRELGDAIATAGAAWGGKSTRPYRVCVPMLCCCVGGLFVGFLVDCVVVA